MNSKTDRRKTRSRRALLDASVELFLMNPGASLSDVAQHAGVGRATLYRHFESREALIRELVLESLELTRSVMQPVLEAALDARETLERGLPEIMTVADRFHFLLSLWSHVDDDAEVNTVYQQQLDWLWNLIERGKREGVIDTSLPTIWIVSLIDCAVYSGWWVVQSGELTAEEAGRHAAHTLFRGISAR